MDFFNIEISWKGIGYIVITSVSSVIVLFILTRIMGKRQISQLTMFDYINGITIGSIAAEMATALDGDVWQPLFAMIIYAFFCNYDFLYQHEIHKSASLFGWKAIFVIRKWKIV